MSGEDELVERTAVLLLKMFGVQRGLFETEKEYISIIQAMAAQIKFHGQSMIQAADTIEAAYVHHKEDAEIKGALYDKEANVLTPILNYQVYLERDPKTTAALLQVVEKEVFLAGLDSLEEDRKVKILCWLNLERAPETTAAILNAVNKNDFLEGFQLLSDEHQADIKRWINQGK